MAIEIPTNLFGLNRQSYTVEPGSQLSARLIRKYLAIGVDFIRDNNPYGPVDYYQDAGNAGNVNLARMADWMEELGDAGLFGMVVLLDRLTPRDNTSTPKVRGIESKLTWSDLHKIRQHCGEVLSTETTKQVVGSGAVAFHTGGSTGSLLQVNGHNWPVGKVIYLTGLGGLVSPTRPGAHFTVATVENANNVKISDDFHWGGSSVNVVNNERVYACETNAMDSSRRFILAAALAGDDSLSVVQGVQAYIVDEVEYIRSLISEDTCLAQALNGPELDGWAQTELQEITFDVASSLNTSFKITLVIGTTEYETDSINFGSSGTGPAASTIQTEINDELPSGSKVTVSKTTDSVTTRYTVLFDGATEHDLRLNTTAPAPQQLIADQNAKDFTTIVFQDVGFVLPGQKLWSQDTQTSVLVDDSVNAVNGIENTILFDTTVSTNVGSILLSGTRVIDATDNETIRATVRSLMKGYNNQGIPWNFEVAANVTAATTALTNSFGVSSNHETRRGNVDKFLDETVKPLWETDGGREGTFFMRGTHMYWFNRKSTIETDPATLTAGYGNREVTGLGDRTDMWVTESNVYPYHYKTPTGGSAQGYSARHGYTGAKGRITVRGSRKPTQLSIRLDQHIS